MRSGLHGSLERLTPGGVEALERDWRALEALCGQSFFVTWGWIGPWLQLVLPRVEVMVYRARRDGQTVALGTLARYRCGRSRILPATVLALNEARIDGLDMVIEHNDLLGLADDLRESRVLLLRTLLAAPFGWSELQLGGVSPAWRVALEEVREALYERLPERRVPWIADIDGITGLAEVLARLSRNRRARIRQSIRHFESTRGPLRTEEPGDTAQALAHFDRMGDLHTARWKRAGLTGSWANPRWVEFHRNVIRTGFARGEVQLLSVFAGDALLGTIYSFLRGGRVYMLQSGFAEPRSNAERPGYVAHCLAMAINGARGRRIYDFLCGDAAYKRSLGLADTPLEWTRYRRRTLRNLLEDRLIDTYRATFADGTSTAASTRVPVVVLGEGITALGVTRAFGRRGIPVFGTSQNDTVLRASRFYRHLPGLGDTPLAPTGADVARALLASGLDHAVLCACSDHFCKAVAELPADLRGRFASRMPAAGTLEILNDKGRFAALLQQLGVAHPFTRIVRDAGDLDGLEGGPPRDLFLKPRDSQSFFARYGVKGYRVASMAEAREKLADITRHGLEMVIQEYVPGPSDNHYFIDGYRDSGGTTRAFFARRRLRIFPPDFGNSTAMVSIPPEQVQQAIDDLERLLVAASYQGIFSAEFKQDPRDGVYRLLEVNTRPWWYVDFAVGSGVDVCDLMYRDALGQSVPSVETYRIGARCIYPYYDYHALQHLRSGGGHYPWLRWARELLGARQPVFAWDDPMPGVRAVLRVLR